ncbi:uncharacterized protein [Venturia canescens]|uniref:uncharacterized protein n=1 Tax=Venturia canescens TaxID=32260 RepID=UPI001C9CC137|nr:uncharacterized protein LOC122407215 [Venturia canescens]
MKGFGRKVFVLIVVLIGSTKTFAQSGLVGNIEDSNPNEDADLTTRELIKKYGYHGESHFVTTDDGYILEMHRITGPNDNAKAEGKQPILMVHAFLSSSTDWIITGPQRALAYLLADAGYDVWMANLRGNSFSRHHVKYSSLNKEFWQFSWHENGVSDLPATIDYVLENTGREELIYLGYSMGTSAFWVMAIERPEYQEKIKAMFALAPVAYVAHARSIFYQFFSTFSNSIEKLSFLLGRYQFDPSSDVLKAIAALACHDDAWTQPLCTNIMFLIGGFGSDHLNTTMLPVILAHAPAGGAVKQFVHYLQLVRDQEFQQYDHGFWGNWKKYKQLRPPRYDLSKVKVPVYLHYSTNDWMADPTDVDHLYRELGNPVGKFLVPHGSFGHLDFAWAKDAKELLYDELISYINKYKNRSVEFSAIVMLDPKYFAFAVFGFFVVEAAVISRSDVLEYNEDADLSTRQLIQKYGYNPEMHYATTDDGYILELHRITGPNNNAKAEGKPVVFLMHGLLSSSADWVITGPHRALAYLLADEGYDVWLGNTRGNTFSRKHKKYSTLDTEFWQFSWHEMGCHDIPAMIDYILKEADQEQLIYVGHSQGTTGFFVMASEHPEYQNKIKAMFALAPVAYMTHMTSPFYQVIARFANNIELLMRLLGFNEFQPTPEVVNEVMKLVCDEKAWTQPVCMNVIFLIAGFGSDQLNKTMLPAILGHVPAGSSVKQVVHYGQLIKAQKFQQYDHGWFGNWRKYKRLTPPHYDLSKIKVPISLHYSSNDMFVNPKDVDRLHKELGNPVGKFRVPHEKFCHLDFLWATDGRQLIYDKLVGLMHNYRN